jgi:dTDP-4-amino-4,6-dideoxygalactose transaminase
MLQSESLEVSKSVSGRIVSLPIHDVMDEADLLKITNIVNRTLE